MLSERRLRPIGIAGRQREDNHLRISIRFKDDVPILSLAGKFLAGADGPFLRQKVNDLIEGGARKMVIDFSGVPYIDSTGIGFLVGAREATQKAGVKMVLLSVNQHVMKILDEVKLSQYFVFVSDEKDATAKLNEMMDDETLGAPSAKKARKRATQPAEPPSEAAELGGASASGKKPD